MNCPNCNSTRNQATDVHGVKQCRKCGAIFGRCYKGDSYRLVLPFMAQDNIPLANTRYYDLTVLGSEGVERRHGWYDPTSKRIVQVG